MDMVREAERELGRGVQEKLNVGIALSSISEQSQWSRAKLLEPKRLRPTKK
jgi:hypothetical protein